MVMAYTVTLLLLVAPTKGHLKGHLLSVTQEQPATHATESRPRWSSFLHPLPILLVITLITLILLDRPLVRGDGIAYLAWIDTLVLDQDVNFNNQHDRFLPVNTYQIEWSFERERWVNIFPFGIAFVQAPFYLMGHLSDQLGILDINPNYFRQNQGVELPYSLWLMIGANVMALGMVVLAWRIGRNYVDDWTAALVVYAVFIGTPILYYSTVSPVNSHNPGAFGVAVVFYLLMRCTNAFDATQKPAGWLHWVLLGVFAGLTVLARWQLLLVVAPCWLLILYERRWCGLAIATVAAGITLLPLPIIWNELFGMPFLVPFDAVNDEAFIQSTGNAGLLVLRELVRHSPVVILSLIGIASLWRINRRWAILCAAVIGLQLAVNGSALDWNAGQSYGMRRMSELYVVYALLACALCGEMIRWARGRNWQWMTPALRGGVLLLVGYTALYFIAYMVFTWTNPDRLFIANPEVMIGFFFQQSAPFRYQVLWEVYRTHLGPLAWGMPGP